MNKKNGRTEGHDHHQTAEDSTVKPPREISRKADERQPFRGKQGSGMDPELAALLALATVAALLLMGVLQ